MVEMAEPRRCPKEQSLGMGSIVGGVLLTDEEYNSNTNVSSWEFHGSSWDWVDVKGTVAAQLVIRQKTKGSTKIYHRTRASKLKFLRDYRAELERLSEEVLSTILEVEKYKGPDLEMCGECETAVPLGHECPNPNDDILCIEDYDEVQPGHSLKECPKCGSTAGLVR